MRPGLVFLQKAATLYFATHHARKAMLSNPGSFDASLERPSPSQENYVQPTVGHGLRIWWAYYWPTSMISFFIIVVLTVLLLVASPCPGPFNEHCASGGNSSGAMLSTP